MNSYRAAIVGAFCGFLVMGLLFVGWGALTLAGPEPDGWESASMARRIVVGALIGGEIFMAFAVPSLLVGAFLGWFYDFAVFRSTKGKPISNFRAGVIGACCGLLLVVVNGVVCVGWQMTWQNEDGGPTTTRVIEGALREWAMFTAYLGLPAALLGALAGFCVSAVRHPNTR